MAQQLGVSEQLDKNWQGVLGSKSKCHDYFKKLLLAGIARALVFGLDGVDMIFGRRAIAGNFFPCYECGRTYALTNNKKILLKITIFTFNINKLVNVLSFCFH